MIDNYFKLIDNLKNEALKEPNCRTVLYPDIYEMNSTPDLKYWVFAITPGIIQAEDDYLTVNLNLYYVYRLDDSKNNYLEIQSAGIQALRNILFRFVNKYPEVDLGSEQFNIFYQKFIDECSGVYVNVSFTIPTSNCLIGEDYE